MYVFVTRLHSFVCNFVTNKKEVIKWNRQKNRLKISMPGIAMAASVADTNMSIIIPMVPRRLSPLPYPL